MKTPSHPLFTYLCCLILLAATSPIAFAQSPRKQEVDSLFAAGAYESVELIVLRLGETPGDVPREEFADMQVTAAFSMIMLNREADARQFFTRALEAVPSLTLDPVMISPKFRVVFEDVRAAFLENERTKPLALYRGAETRSHLLNLALPGAGQIREGKVVKGICFLALEAVAVGLWIQQLGTTSDSRKDYLAQTEEAAIKRSYDDYNSEYQLAWVYGLASGAVYLAAQTDLAFLRTKARTNGNGYAVQLVPTVTGASVRVNW